MRDEDTLKVIWGAICCVVGLVIMFTGIGILPGYIIGHHGVVVLQQVFKD